MAEKRILLIRMPLGARWPGTEAGRSHDPDPACCPYHYNPPHLHDWTTRVPVPPRSNVTLQQAGQAGPQARIAVQVLQSAGAPGCRRGISGPARCPRSGPRRFPSGDCVPVSSGCLRNWRRLAGIPGFSPKFGQNHSKTFPERKSSACQDAIMAYDINALSRILAFSGRHCIEREFNILQQF